MRKTETFHQAITRYLIGGAAALALTVGAYLLATIGGGSSTRLFAAGILLLAVIQVVVQLYAFLHVNDEVKPRLQSTSFVFTVATLLIVVLGSLWIMRNLDYRMGMSPDQIIEYMLEQNGKGF